jgi:hypothetical protein
LITPPLGLPRSLRDPGNPARLHVRDERKAHLFVITEPDAGSVGIVEDADPANLILP